MKTKLLTSIILCAASTTFAQNQITVSAGSGVGISTTRLKNETGTGNGYQLGTDIFIPFFSSPENPGLNSSYAIGILAGAGYGQFKNSSPATDILSSKYKLYNGNLEIQNQQNGPSNSFNAFGGLQANLSPGKITFSPSIAAAYAHLTRKGFSQTSTIIVNGESRLITLRDQPENSKNSLLIIPQLRISYPLTSNLRIYTAAAIQLGPEILTTQHYLKPTGGYNAQNTYEPGQLSTGTMISQDTRTRYSVTNINLGLSWSFGTGSASRRLKGKVTKPGDNGLRSEALAAKSINEKGVTNTKNHGSANAFVAGNPIGGIIVKGGKNPGGGQFNLITNQKGEFEFHVADAGNYIFTITTPDEPQGKSISSKGVSSTKSRPNARAMSPGSPIGGIVVKGGKNPGGNLIVLTTNANGQVELNGLEAGNYLFTIAARPTTDAKSISEKGLKRNNQ